MQARYKLPAEVVFCRRCTVSNQRPRIQFNEQGICSACQFSEHKQSVDWSQRELELEALCDQYRKKDGSYDVVVPCSGGKDGSFVAHQLKHRYGMNPLTVTWAPLMPTEIGRKNLDAFIASGFDHILGTANPDVSRRLTRLALIHLGDPFQPFIYGQTNFPLRVAVQHDISLIMYGENGEVEYGGDMKNAYKPGREISDHNSHYFSGIPPEFWQSHGITHQELSAFLPPSFDAIKTNKTAIQFFSYYKCWDPQENYYYCREHTGFQPNSERSEGTYSKYASLDDCFDGFHYYFGYLKFGIGRATSDSAHEIRDDKITRAEGVNLVHRYDGEFPQKYLREFLDYCDIDGPTFERVMDSWRAKHLWEKAQGEWRLCHSVH